MPTITISRMVECDHCYEGIPDGQMRQVYHLVGPLEVIDGYVHAACEADYVKILDEEARGIFRFANGEIDDEPSYKMGGPA